MGVGELTRQGADSGRELHEGEVVTASGRLSVARRIGQEPPELPFTSVQLSRLDEALTLSSRSTGLDFSVYLGWLEPDENGDIRPAAERLHASTGEKASTSVLLVVSPGQRQLEIVTGEEAHRRIADRSCKLAAMSMVASFKEGDLVGGLLSGLRMLTDQAGPEHRR
ncbi:MAG: DUF5130 family protein [Sciscionella sp.]